jgi:siroheme synthase
MRRPCVRDRNGKGRAGWIGRRGPLKQTLVIYMGVGTAGCIAARLIDNGLDAATPVAVIENGTLPTQRAVYGRLSELNWLVRHSGIAGPALIVIGSVAALTEAAAAFAAPVRAIAYRGD